jgi:hypothetical protein
VKHLVSTNLEGCEFFCCPVSDSLIIDIHQDSPGAYYLCLVGKEKIGLLGGLKLWRSSLNEA